jgi:hypothetical protein
MIENLLESLGCAAQPCAILAAGDVRTGLTRMTDTDGTKASTVPAVLERRSLNESASETVDVFRGAFDPVVRSHKT